MKRIAIAINSLNNCQFEAYHNHIQFFYALGRNYPKYEFLLINTARMSIDRFRNMAAEVAIENKCSYLLFLDDDVIAPLLGLDQLIAMDVDVSAGNVIIRGYPFDFMTFKWDDETQVNMSTIKDTRTGIETVAAVGFSFCLIKVELLEKIKKPFFVTGINHTEDVYFCYRAFKEFQATIQVNWDINCHHIMWGETISPQNRDAYKKYYEDMNPLVTKDPTTTIVNKVGVSYEDELTRIMEEDSLNVKVK